jgi:hypothetical protein
MPFIPPPEATFLGSATTAGGTDLGPIVFGPGWGVLIVNIYITGYAGSQIAKIRLGTGTTVDTGTNYSFWAQNFTAAATAGGSNVSQTGFNVAQVAQTTGRRGNAVIHNSSGQNKIITLEGTDYSASSPTAASAMAGAHVVAGAWFNTAQAQCIGLNSGGGSNLNSGTIISVYGIPGTG